MSIQLVQNRVGSKIREPKLKRNNCNNQRIDSIIKVIKAMDQEEGLQLNHLLLQRLLSMHLNKNMSIRGTRIMIFN